MTDSDKKEMRDFLHDTIGGYIARVEAQNEITNLKLGTISDTLTKQNGRLGKAEEAIQMALQERGANRQKQEDYFNQISHIDERVATLEKNDTKHYLACPNTNAIRALQDESLSHKSVKKFMGVMFAAGVGLGGLVIGIVELIIKLTA